MDALDVIKVCLRRWWVMLPVLAIALGIGAGLVSQQVPSYSSYASYALIYENHETLRPTDPDPREANPLAGDGAALLGEALAAELATADRQRELALPGMTGVAPGQTSNGSRFSVALTANSRSWYVSTWGPRPDDLQVSLDKILAELPTMVADIQTRAGAPVKSQYVPFTTTPTQVVELPPGSPAKIMTAILGLGVVAGAALSMLVDQLIARRRRARDSDSDPDSGSLAEPGPSSKGPRGPKGPKGTSAPVGSARPSPAKRPSAAKRPSKRPVKGAAKSRPTAASLAPSTS